MIRDSGDYSGTDNNIVFWNGHGFSCTFDPHETDSMHPFKAAYGKNLPGPDEVASIAHSPDGLHRHHYNNGDDVTHRANDTHNQIKPSPSIGAPPLETSSRISSPHRPNDRTDVAIVI